MSAPRGSSRRSDGIALCAVTTLAVAVLAGAVLLDPYAFRLNASDMVMTAPWWHPAVAFSDVAMLVAVAVAIWSRPVAVRRLLLAETGLNVATSGVYVWIDGLARFSMGWASTSILRLFLALVTARIVLAMLWTRPPDQRTSSPIP